MPHKKYTIGFPPSKKKIIELKVVVCLVVVDVVSEKCIFEQKISVSVMSRKAKNCGIRSVKLSALNSKSIFDDNDAPQFYFLRKMSFSFAVRQEFDWLDTTIHNYLSFPSRCWFDAALLNEIIDSISTAMQLSHQRISLIDSNWIIFSPSILSLLTLLKVIRKLPPLPKKNKHSSQVALNHLFKCAPLKRSIFSNFLKSFFHYNSTCKPKCVKNVNVTECRAHAR